MIPLIIAHRGASHAAPENTMSAFQLAWEENADGIECDVRLTKDKQIICIHDATTQRTTGQNYLVKKTPWEQLKQLDAGSWKAPQYKGEPLPLLQNVLTALPPNKRLLIEIKCGAEIIPHLATLLTNNPTTCEQIRLISFDKNAIKEARKTLPHIHAYWITDFKRKLTFLWWTPTIRHILRTLKNIDASGLDCKAHKSITTHWVKKLKAQNHAWHVWTIDDPAKAHHFTCLGVQSITTNRPANLRSEMKTSQQTKRPPTPN